VFAQSAAKVDMAPRVRAAMAVVATVDVMETCQVRLLKVQLAKEHRNSFIHHSDV
jgi:hypothetical protein